MSVIIKIEWLGGHEAMPSEVEGCYLKEFNHDGHGGIGDLTATHVRGEAKQFQSHSEAMEYWKRQSRVRPLRPDGKPNRPLTAFTVSLENL